MKNSMLPIWLAHGFAAGALEVVCTRCIQAGDPPPGWMPAAILLLGLSGLVIGGLTVAIERRGE